MQASRLTDKSLLTSGIVWVLLTYADGSQFCFQTSLNPDVLRDRGIVLEEGKLPRLDKQYFVWGQMVYRQFPFAGTTVQLWTGEHYDDPASEAIKDFL